MPEFTPLNGEGMEKLNLKEENVSDNECLDLKAKNEPEQSGEDEKPVKTPVTPRKRGRKPANGNSTAATTATDADGDDISPTKKTRTSPAKSKPNGKKTESRSLPASYEMASPEDKMMLRMKDDEGKAWAEIREAWEDMTGNKVGNSTLSNRYKRIKEAFTVVNPEDEARIMSAKKDVEDRLEIEKWHRIADAVETSGGKRYPPAVLQKKFKEISKVQ